MGTLMGHVLPGTFFISFSLWWLVRGLHKYYTRRGQHVNRTTMACCCKNQCFQKVPLDLWVFIILAIIGGILEIATSYINVGKFITGNKQHMTMYTAFALAAFVSILVHHQLKFVTKGAEYLAFIIALAVELILFAFHLHGREPLDIHIHMLLVYTIGGGIIATAAEYQFPHSINAFIARHYTLLLQGTWFYQIAFTLYPPDGITKWDVNDMENIMMITLVYAWHMIACFMGVLLISALVHCCSGRKGTSHRCQDQMNLLPTQHGGSTKSHLLVDEHSYDETS